MMMDKDLRKLVKALTDAGYLCVTRKNGHVLVIDPETEKVITEFGGTPSDRRAWLNGLAPLKRRGFTWPPRR